jgi:hypothetical protein
VTRITGSAIATFRSKGYGIIPAVLDTRQLGAARAMVASLLAAEPPEPGHAGPYFLWPRFGAGGHPLLDLYRSAGICALAAELLRGGLVGQVALVEPDPATWREQLRQVMTDFHDVLVSHTDAALAGLGRIPTSPQTMAAAEVLAGIMRAGGLCPTVVALGLDQLVLYVSATAFEDGLFRRGTDEEEMLRYYAGVHAFYAALPADRYPVLASIAPDMTGHDDVERFSFGLDVLISGLEAVNARVRDPGQGVGQGEP